MWDSTALCFLCRLWKHVKMQAWQSLLEYPISTAGSWRWSWISQDLSTNLSAIRYDYKPTAVPVLMPLPCGERRGNRQPKLLHAEGWCTLCHRRCPPYCHASTCSSKILLILSRLKINIWRCWNDRFPLFLLQDYKTGASVPSSVTRFNAESMQILNLCHVPDFKSKKFKTNHSELASLQRSHVYLSWLQTKTTLSISDPAWVTLSFPSLKAIRSNS